MVPSRSVSFFVVTLSLALFAGVGCSSDAPHNVGNTAVLDAGLDGGADATLDVVAVDVVDGGGTTDVTVQDVASLDVAGDAVADSGQADAGKGDAAAVDAAQQDVPTLDADQDGGDIFTGTDVTGADVTGADATSEDGGGDAATTDAATTDAATTDTSAPSCKDQCGKELAAGGCQCDPACVAQGDCCTDWKPLCGCEADKDCDDGDACTVDACDTKTGACKGPTPTICDDGNVCTADSCDKAKGCQTTANASACDDNSACTKGDACADGKCGGVAKVCDDGDPCTLDTCDAKTGACGATPSKAGGPCDDTNPCTTKDVCKAGKCGGSPVSCDDGNACTTDVCAAKTGACDYLIVTDGKLCDDGSACTSADACKAGACVGKGKGCDDGDACTVDTCDPKTSKCSSAPAKDGAACSDFNPCTGSDMCTKGACAGTLKSCDDGDPCTVDACDKQDGACKTTAAKDGGACDDGDACTASSACSKGKCVGGSVSCDDGQPCTKDSCDPKTGKCANTAVLEGQPCDDGQKCTDKDSCTKGTCSGNKKLCIDGKPCTIDTCAAKTGACQHTGAADGATCTDGNACTTGDLCKAGACVAGTDVCGTKTVWSDDIGCATKSWTAAPNDKEPAVAWHVDATPAAPKPHSGACTLNFNNGKNYVTAGGPSAGAITSVAVAVPKADDVQVNFWSYANIETSASYDKRFVEISADGFQKTVQSVQLDDKISPKAWHLIKIDMSQWAGQEVQLRFRFDSVDTFSNATAGWFVDDVAITAGTKPASCVGSCGQFVAGASCQCDVACAGNCCADVKTVCGGCKVAKDCDDGLSCTTDACVAGSCANTPVATSAACDDGEVCTIKDVCVNGRCGGAPRSCDDGNPCTWDTCDALKGCVSTTVTGGKACDDGKPCTVSDLCSKGKCAGGKAKCDDGNSCTTDSCDPKSAACSAVKRADGLTCTDGDVCTSGDRCFGGACTKGLPKCNDGNTCTVDSCAAKTGKCSHKAAADGALCSDGDSCSLGDVCASGACKGKASCTFSSFYTNKIDCGSEKDWAMSPANKEPSNGWHIDATAAKPGYQSAKCSLNFNDGKNYVGVGGKQTGTAQLLIKIALPAKGNPRLKFASYHGMESSNSYDKRFVQVSVDGFKSVALSTKLDNSKGKGAWSNVIIDLAALAGKSVQVRFIFDSVDGFDNTGLGWFVDDLTIESGSVGKLSCTGDAACHDGKACTADKCVTGVCQWTPLKDGAACGDGNPCISNAGCKSGVCAGTSVKVCNDGKPCTADLCDPSKGCVFTQVANGGACDDGDGCTAKDVCNSGACKGVANCDDGNSCTVDSCDAQTGKCSAKLANDGMTCDDGNLCTSGDACTKGACAAKVKSCDDGNACTVGSCDQKDGKCTSTTVKDGTTCTDGNSCSLGDICEAGQCAGKDVCTYAKLIDDAFVCGKNEGWTFAPDVKEPAVAWHIDATPAAVKPHSGACTLNMNNGKNIANGGKAQQGAATSKQVSVPQSGNARLRFWSWHGVELNDSYDKRTVLISSDGFKSAVAAVLLSNTKDKAKAWMSHEISLNAWLGKKIQVRFVLDTVDGAQNAGAGWFVDDVMVEVGSGAAALSCTGRCGLFSAGAKCQCNAKCVAAGDCCQDYDATCTGCLSDANCDDGNACTVDTCDKASGQCKNTVAQDGAACDDGSKCMLGGTCGGGVCSGKSKACVDSNVCTFNTCKAGVGCVFPANAATCDDKNPCTEKDTCSNKSCKGASKSCDDSNACTNDSCAAKGGGCVNKAKTNGAFCSDGQVCTTPDACQAGKCVGKLKGCDDGVACTVDSCDPKTGACAHKATADGTACNDGDPCTLTSSCKAGTCTGADTCQSKTAYSDVFACAGVTGWTFQKPAAAGDPAFAIDATPVVPKAQACSLNFNNGKNFVGVKGGRVQGAASSAPITVPAAAGASLTFLSYHDTETTQSYDKRFVEVSDDNFVAHVQQRQLVNGVGKGTWTLQTVSLSQWLGKSIRVRFRFDSKDGISNTGAGWFVDDLKVVAKATLSACKTAKDCGDGGSCATAACTKGTCVFTPAAKDGVTCDDGDACTTGDVCTKGVCGGQGKVCDDKKPCTWDACSPATGACTAVPASDGTACGGGKVCAAGVCAG